MIQEVGNEHRGHGGQTGGQPDERKDSEQETAV